ncbi:MAG: immunity 49 family protein [Deltaproteobacteria bacterium]|nr:immunity 49 family protein [Kofleriaceae bacterium]
MADTIGPRATNLAQLDQDEWNGQFLGGMSVQAFDNATVRSYRNPLDKMILVDLERCGCAAAAAYLAAVIPGDDPIDAPGPRGRVVKIDRTKLDRRKLEPAVQWRWGMLAAAAARNHAAIDALASVRPEHLATVGRPAPSWFASEATALAATFRRDANAGDLLAAAMKAADPAKVPAQSKNWVLDIVAGELELAFRVVSNDAAAFDGMMSEALDRHHHYYGSDGKNDTQGQIALAPLAIACLARDLGLRTSVVSDYTPSWIIESPSTWKLP